MIATALGIIGGLVIEKQEQAMAKALEMARKEKGVRQSTSWWMSYTVRRLLGGFVIFNLVLWSGTVGFILTEGMSFLDATYVSVVTLATIGERTRRTEALFNTTKFG